MRRCEEGGKKGGKEGGIGDGIEGEDGCGIGMRWIIGDWCGCGMRVEGGDGDGIARDGCIDVRVEVLVSVW